MKTNDAVNVVARIISVLFHPLLMMSYLFGVLVLFFPSALDPLKEETYWNFILLIFCVSFVLPALNIGIFKAFGTIQTFTMRDRRERVLPFIFITILYCVVTYLFYTKTGVSSTDSLLKFLIIIDALVLVATVVTFFYKISVHSLAMWGTVGILFALNKVSENGALFYPILGSLVITGIVMSARLQLNVHSLREVTVGGMLGLVVSSLLMAFMF